MNDVEPDYKAALIELLNTAGEWAEVVVRTEDVWVRLDGDWHGPAITAALRKLLEEGVIKEDA